MKSIFLFIVLVIVVFMASSVSAHTLVSPKKENLEQIRREGGVEAGGVIYQEKDLVWFSPSRGNGSVQMAEMSYFLPANFIKLNKNLHNYRYLGRPSLIYMGQKFAVPLTPKLKKMLSAKSPANSIKVKEIVKVVKVENSVKSKQLQEQGLSKIEKVEKDKSEVQKIDPVLDAQIKDIVSSLESKKQARENFIPKVDPSSGSSKKMLLIAVALLIVVLLFSIKWEVCQIDEINETNKTDNKILEEFSDTGGTKISKKWSFLGSNKDHIFVCCCLSTGNFMVVHGGSSYQSEHGGKEGLEEIFHFIKTVYGEEARELVKFEVPNCYADSYRSLTSEERKL